MPVPVVDVFAGPGGLNEGFSAVSGGRAFSTVASIEMDPVACRTLTLRAAARSAIRLDGVLPDAYWEFTTRSQRGLDELATDEHFAVHLKAAAEEVHQHELSGPSRFVSDALIREALGETLKRDEPWVLVGGPPCQAYSLAGRSRRTNDAEFANDHKHTLYREYLNIIQKFRPTVFVMENVKGMLSSRHDGGAIFDAILRDLRAPAKGLAYELRSFVVPDEPSGEIQPRDFIVRAEQFGVPQRRHRVLILGIRSDALPPTVPTLTPAMNEVPLWQVLHDLPKIRSGVSPRGQDSWPSWVEAQVLGSSAAGARIRVPRELSMGQPSYPRYTSRLTGDLGSWLRRPEETGLRQHESRHHMALDLARYAYLAQLADMGVAPPRVNELPPRLMPKHANAARADTPFADRFRVQVKARPSSTITSHIAKDGHYYIHPDPTQARSLTVREAARLQTFPDNYFFMGNRTHQYHQVGNAVPPFLARQLGQVVAEVLGLGGDSA